MSTSRRMHDAERFLMALDEEEEIFTFQTFDDNAKRKNPALARTVHGRIQDLWGDLCQMNDAGAGVFVAINAIRQGARRTAENVVRVRALFADHDKPLEALPAYPVEPSIIVQSSPQKKHVYWLVEDISLGEFPDLQKAIAACGGSDPVVFDLPRVMRLPGFNHQKGDPFLVRIEDYARPIPYAGNVLRQAFLRWVPSADQSIAAQQNSQLPDNAPVDAHRRAVIKIAFDAARRTHENPVSSRHAEVVRMGHFMRREGLPGDSGLFHLALDTFAEHMRPTDTTGQAVPMNKAQELITLAGVFYRPSAPDRPKAKSREQSGPQMGGPPLAGELTEFGSQLAGVEIDGLPLIRVTSGDLKQVINRAESVLINSGIEVYQYGTRLVRVGSWEGVPSEISRPVGAGVLIDVCQDWLVEELTAAAEWQRFDARVKDWVTIDAPLKMARTLLARRQWKFDHLAGFCDSPTLTLSGRVVSSPGYDGASGLYLNNPPKIKPIKKTRLEYAKRAADMLFELVSTFPFVNHSSRSAGLAAMMTMLLRRVLPAAPLMCVSASTPGTGKSLLVDCMAALATGKKAPVTAVGKDNEELEKRLDSMLLKGDAVCSFDNVDRAMKSDILCQVTTQQVKTVRVLSKSQVVEAPTNISLLMTGNNLTLLGDITRRALMIYLDAGHERPETIEHSRDAIEHVLKFRDEGIRNALMISKAYIDAGCPKVECLRFGSFEQWDRMVRKPLIWAGWPDPLAPASELRDQDHDFQGMVELFRAWSEEIGWDEVTAAEVREMVTARVERISGGFIAEFPKIQDAAVTVLGNVNKWGARELGYKLRSWQGRIVGGMRIVNSGRKSTGVHWRLEKTVNESSEENKP